ncbi:helix-turn-helix domain-containing protein [Streptomyces eurocidicus]|uniref:Transcriptional regulator with XRE-family HTH domain n=1 Tax=Streptomyces eurocidicus TaxID=66423 RepID=A0A7W8BGR5_STREU|nr:helix-turn-helix domain-containing protein [Streptomyces eurocidicus]MBB5121154.1 transcriptional regulator with XRE-family HTH domain [Streptomyces eurocidicus]
MNWSDSAVRTASSQGDYGRVIRLVRESARLTQGQLGGACGLSQSAVSRLEKRGAGEYNMTALARAAHHLGIPLRLVGLADSDAAPGKLRDGNDEVERRKLLAGVAAVAATPVLNTATPPRAEWEGGQAAVLRVATTAYRRMDATAPARQLSDTVQGHMRLVQTVASQTNDQSTRTRLAAVGSEVASLVGWLSWDMADQGSARTWYGAAIKAARRAADPLLIAYQQGSLAQFEVEYGNCAQGLALIRSARRQLGSERPPIAAAWLSSLEAVAHATAGDDRAADRALTASAAEAARMAADAAPPWPWVLYLRRAQDRSCPGHLWRPVSAAPVGSFLHRRRNGCSFVQPREAASTPYAGCRYGAPGRGLSRRRFWSRNSGARHRSATTLRTGGRAGPELPPGLLVRIAAGACPRLRRAT